MDTANRSKFLLEELAFDGTGNGLESEPAEHPEVGIKYPFDPKKIDVITQTKTVNLLMSRLNNGELNLSPDFQRRSNLWNAEQKSSLIESMMLKIPIPSLYLSEDEEGTLTVVDGLQRLCAIAHFIDYRILNKAVQSKLGEMKLQNLGALGDYENYTFAMLPRSLSRRIDETELTLHIIRAGTPQEVKFNIFSRINRGGISLKGQEIRNAIFPGIWRKYVREMASSDIFKDATEFKIKGERQEDMELILRFVAHYNLYFNEKKRPSDQYLDEFLNKFVQEDIKHNFGFTWENYVKAFERSMLYSFKVFGEMRFRKPSTNSSYRSPINRGLFESQSVALALRSEDELDILARHKRKISKKLGLLLESDTDFNKATSSGTGRGWASNIRLEAIDKIFDEVLDADEN